MTVGGITFERMTSAITKHVGFKESFTRRVKTTSTTVTITLNILPIS
jgi:hypothetical protein